MTPTIQLRVARIVQFDEIKYIERGVLFEFLVDVLRPVILEENRAIDIFSHQIFDIVPMVGDNIAISTLRDLEQEKLYAYQIFDAKVPANYLEEYLKKALETYRWYYEEYKPSVSESPKKYAKIIQLEDARKKYAKQTNSSNSEE